MNAAKLTVVCSGCELKKLCLVSPLKAKQDHRCRIYFAEKLRRKLEQFPILFPN